jgi:hypothetical protein
MVARMKSPSQHALQIDGTPVKLGTIIATTTKNNHDTATPFNNTGDALKGKLLMLQPDAACYVSFGTTNAATAATTDVYLAAYERVLISMAENYGWIACVSVSGTTNLKVWEMY